MADTQEEDENLSRSNAPTNVITAETTTDIKPKDKQKHRSGPGEVVSNPSIQSTNSGSRSSSSTPSIDSSAFRHKLSLSTGIASRVRVVESNEQVVRLRRDSLSTVMALTASGGYGRRKSTFALDSHTPIMSRKRSIRSHMSELEAMAAERRKLTASSGRLSQAYLSPRSRSARIDLLSVRRTSCIPERYNKAPAVETRLASDLKSTTDNQDLMTLSEHSTETDRTPLPPSENPPKLTEQTTRAATMTNPESHLMNRTDLPSDFIQNGKTPIKEKRNEEEVIFRLGRLLPGGARGPGIFLIVPCTDTYRKVDLRVISFEVAPQEILSKDSVTVAVDAVVYFRISNATISVTNVEDASRSTKLLAQTTLRNILGTKTLAEMLSDREAISLQIQATLDDATEPWGVKVERVEVKDIRLPVQLQRAMAAEAEAVREARAKVIVAEGEQKASRALKEAAEVIAQSPSALQLRYLQTLNSISAEKNSTIIFPLPIDLISSFLGRSSPKPPPEKPPAGKVRTCCLYKYPSWIQDLIIYSQQQTDQQKPPQQALNHSSSSRSATTATLPSGQSMRDSPAYQMHSSAAGTSFSDDSPHSSFPAPNTYWNGQENTRTNRQNGQSCRNSSPSILLKTALANRMIPLFNSQNSKVGRPPIAPNSSLHLNDSGHQQNGQNRYHQQNGYYQQDEAGGQDSKTDEMSTSILKNPAWYRDNEGRTGMCLPKEWLNSKKIQQTEIKPRNSSSRSPTPERFMVKRTASMETQRKPPQDYLNNQNGIPAVQPRTSSLFHRPNKLENGFGQRSNTDYGFVGSMLKNGMERRGSSQSVSSRGSLAPKSVTFCDQVVVNEIARKQEEDEDYEDAELPYTMRHEFLHNLSDDRSSVSPRIDEPLPTHTGRLLHLPLLNTSHSSEDTSPIMQPSPPHLIPSEELRSSPSLNLDEIVYDARQRPESLSEDEWRMIQSIYLPGKHPDNEASSVVDFQPISVDVGREMRSLTARHSLSPSRRQQISPSFNETRKIFQPDPDNNSSKPAIRPRIFGQFSPPPRRRLQPKRHMFYSPTRHPGSSTFYDLRIANQREIENQMAEKQATGTPLNGYRSYSSPTRQPDLPFSVVPPNRSTSPLNSNPIYKELSCRNWTTTMTSENSVHGSKLPSPRPVTRPNASNDYVASDELTPIQTAKRSPVAPAANQVRTSTIKPPLPKLPDTSSAMQQSFYDNVDLEQEKQQKFISRFGRQPPRTVVIKNDDQITPPPSDPEQPKPFRSRKESSDSVASTTSRESILSATSMRADIKLRRNFNY